MADANSWEEQLIADIRANGGRPTGGPLKGHPLMVLYTTGAKSGQQRRAIATYSRDGEDYVIAGTNNARESNPTWVANIAAHPDVRFEIGTDMIEGTAHRVDGRERDRLWANHVSTNPNFARYETQVTGREIPVIRITPRR